MHSAFTPNSGKSMSQRRSSSSSKISLSLLQAPTGALPSSRLVFLLKHLRRENIYKNAQKATTAQAATTANSTFSLPPPSGKSRTQMRSTTKSSSVKSLSLTSPLRAPSADAGLDFLQEMHLRRERAYKKAQKAARKERTATLEEALKITYEGW